MKNLITFSSLFVLGALSLLVSSSLTPKNVPLDLLDEDTPLYL